MALADRSGGTAALYRGTPQWLFRDMHPGTQHASSGPAILQARGRELAGPAQDTAWAQHVEARGHLSPAPSPRGSVAAT